MQSLTNISMLFARLVVSAILVGSTTAPSVSGELPPAEIVAREITSGGKLIACSLEFSAAFRDHVYKKGEPVGVTGSINLWHGKGQIYASFKLVGADFVGATPVRFKVATASLFDPTGKPYNSVVSGCEDERDYCAAMPFEAFLGTVLLIAEKGQLRMAYNRRPGGMDVPINLDVAPHESLKLFDCAQTLGKQALEK